MNGGMPRPPKHVPPNTLGGRIRAARESLHLSLASVAGDRYSTSLISQIERNRVEPSQESLEFLAQRLALPLEDLKLLVQQQREAEVLDHQVHLFETLYTKAAQAFTAKQPYEALRLLEGLNFPRIAPELRWRFSALRGQCYFSLRQFLAAQKDFLYAVIEQPLYVPTDQHKEVIDLHLHLAAALRELEQPDAAFEEYQVALNMMDANAPLNYVAETHWGMSLIAFQRANKSECPHKKEDLYELALTHAENASGLYRSIGEAVRFALLTCHIALIHQEQGQLDDARKELDKLLQKWLPELEQEVSSPNGEARHLADISNLVSAVACSLAGVEYQVENFDEALSYVQQARYASDFSNKLRKAEAAMMHGRILEAITMNEEAEAAFREAVDILAETERLAARIRAYDLLGRHLLKTGKIREGEQELDHAQHLSHLASVFTSTTIAVEAELEDSVKLS
jgi:tetratricopeptide (TPR) repeat protein